MFPWAEAQVLRHNEAMPPVILMYHSVRKARRDPFALCVSPRRFAQHMRIVASMTEPVRLNRMIEPQVPPRAVAVTFDDGYADNLHHALPVLERFNIPATIFIATGYVGGTREFWWDELERLLLGRGRINRNFTLGLGEAKRTFGSDGAARRGRLAAWRGRHWKAWDTAAADARQVLFNEIRRWLKRETVPDREEALTALRQVVHGVEVRNRSALALTLDGLRRMAAHPLIDIGAHTVNHPSLGWLDAPAQREEISRSRAWLRDHMARPITLFAYPHGSSTADERDYTPQTVEFVLAAGFDGAVTTRDASVAPSDQAWELPRRHVHDWEGDEFARRLNNWLGDPA